MYKYKFVLLIFLIYFYNFDLRGHFWGQKRQSILRSPKNRCSVHPTTNVYKYRFVLLIFLSKIYLYYFDLRCHLWGQKGQLLFNSSNDKYLYVTIFSSNFSKNNLPLQLWPPRSFWRSKRSINVRKTRTLYFQSFNVQQQQCMQSTLLY